MIDGFGRHINYLRLAVTDRCNLRCHYCMPEEGINYIPREELLSYEEMIRLIKILATNDVQKLRITGGEPFVRKDLIPFLESVNQHTNIQSLNITTNGTLCKPHLDAIEKLHFNSINLSLDTLDRDRFYQISRRKGLEDVLDVLDAFTLMDVKLKINMVVMSDSNIEDIIPMALLAKDKNISVRFIEEMPFNGGSERVKADIWNHKDILTYLEKEFGALQHSVASHGATAVNYKPKGFEGNLGIIPAHSRTFCGLCNRLRITAKGILKTCLYDKGVFDLKSFMRHGASDEDLLLTVQSALLNKAKDGFEAEGKRSQNKLMESMSTIGG
jgi:molybdenum cofactor biosynthesis protein A